MPRLSPAQIADVARKTREDRERAAQRALEPSPQEQKEHQRIAHRLMRRRAAIQRGYL